MNKTDVQYKINRWLIIATLCNSAAVSLVALAVIIQAVLR